MHGSKQLLAVCFQTGIITYDERGVTFPAGPLQYTVQIHAYNTERGRERERERETCASRHAQKAPINDVSWTRYSAAPPAAYKPSLSSRINAAVTRTLADIQRPKQADRQTGGPPQGCGVGGEATIKRLVIKPRAALQRPVSHSASSHLLRRKK